MNNFILHGDIYMHSTIMFMYTGDISIMTYGNNILTLLYKLTILMKNDQNSMILK